MRFPSYDDRPSRGLLIVNADDWGRDVATTESILDCFNRRSVTTVSAMVFMADSRRAAALALEHRVPAGLHLNFTTPFTAPGCPGRLADHQRRVAAYLRRHRFAPLVFNPALAGSFEYLVAAQRDEFDRLYGAAPDHFDGHHHMHLCANVLVGDLLPRRAVVRRHFSFQPGEKPFLNRAYRRVVDTVLSRRYRVVDFFFALPPLQPASRLQRIVALAHDDVVEVETHPAELEEYCFLTGPALFEWTGHVRMGSHALMIDLTSAPGHDRPSPAISVRRGSGSQPMPHVSVCICTYRRLALLERLLIALGDQETGDRFTYSIVVADNDGGQSARPIVEVFAQRAPISVTYSCEPRQNIALARNLAVSHASGEYVAFIDDDELPVKDWLLQLFETCSRHDVQGTLGPVRPVFDQPPPQWLLRGRFFDRPEHRTGAIVPWFEARTGNVLMRREILGGEAGPFREAFGSGSEDTDFFRRMATSGYVFNWCNEAVVSETVPPTRWKRRYLLKRALLRGQNYRRLAGWGSLIKSLLAVPAYSILLPFLIILGQHHFMRCSIKLCDHAGRLLAFFCLRPAGDKYITG
jgi:predicted glycoside hydrolase/deacetylase ChbG (UPF0249 family)/glycosyltransferase involved in cell wall biosynthesis